MKKRNKKKKPVIPVYHFIINPSKLLEDDHHLKVYEWQKNFVESQQPLPVDFKSVYHKNSWHLYES